MIERRDGRRIAWMGLAALFGLAWPAAGQGLTRPPVQAQAPAQGQPRRVEARPEIPARVADVLRSVDETGQAPRGVMGGRVFENRAERGEQPLPKVDREGDPIVYHTWDVNPRAGEADRGRERLVVGTDGSAYYTADYYKTFTTVRNPSRSSLAGGVHVAPAPPLPDRERPASVPLNRNAPARRSDKPVVALDPKLAARVNPVVDYILAHGEAPPETVGGRDYRNLGLEDGEVLPRSDAQGRPIRYREWDVNKKVPGRNRGAERLITGSDGRVYYTNDHYATFQRVR